MDRKFRIIIVAIVFFILGAIIPIFFLNSFYEQRDNDNEAVSIDVDLNASIVNLKNIDEGRMDMLRTTLERDLSYNIRSAHILLARSKLSADSRKELSDKVTKAEMALKDRSKTLEELLFAK